MHSFGGFFYFLFGAFYFHKTKFYLVINNFRFAERRSVVFYMKKNNKFRNNNYNNQILSLNYRFDSISSAGKCSGTALDLIKRYNELAKEAQGNGDLVEAEVFRQYAEHYRKIVTEINERKMQQPRQPRVSNESETAETAEVAVSENVEIAKTAASETPVKREFKVIEISPETAAAEITSSQNDEKPKAARPRGRRKAEVAAAL